MEMCRGSLGEGLRAVEAQAIFLGYRVCCPGVLCAPFGRGA